MKKIVFCLIAVGIFSFNSFAQFSQGSVSVGGAFNLWFQNPKTEYANQTVDGPKTTHFTLLPSVEYFLTENVSLGLGIGYDVTRSKSADLPNNVVEQINKTGTFFFDPYARMYFKVGDKFSFFGQGEISLGFGGITDETKYTNNTSVSTKNSFSTVLVGIRPGISFLVSEKVALETSFGFLGYQGTSQENGANQKNKSSNYGLMLNSSTLNFGIRFFIK